MRPFYDSQPIDRATDWDAMRNDGNPLHMTVRLFALLYAAHHGDAAAKQDAARGLDLLVNHWPNLTNHGAIYRWNYNKPYNNVPPGWWSGMGSFLGIAVLIAADEIFNNDAYLHLAHRALKSSLLPPTEGGSVWRDGDKCWISEYSWNGMKPSDEFYVLNGHLFAVQALKMIADTLHDQEAENVYQCAVRGTAAKIDDFAIPDWSLYMLNKPTIDPLHYVIFELSQFEALFAMTNDPLFSKEAARRRRLFASLFPIELDPQTSELVVARIGAPHPYIIDIYYNQIACKLDDGSAWTSRRFPISESSIKDRGFIRVKPPHPPEKCDLISLMGNQPVVLYSASPIIVRDSELAPQPIETSVDASYDALVAQGRNVTVSPQRQHESGPDNYQSTKATITLSGDLDVSRTELFGLELTSSRKTAIGVSMSDADGHSIFRYYPAVEANIKTQILLSLLGFDDYKSLNQPKSLTLTFYTDKASMPNQDDFNVEVGDLYKFPSAIALERYFVSSGVTVPDLVR